MSPEGLSGKLEILFGAFLEAPKFLKTFFGRAFHMVRAVCVHAKNQDHVVNATVATG